MTKDGCYEKGERNAANNKQRVLTQNTGKESNGRKAKESEGKESVSTPKRRKGREEGRANGE
jgi:hypothetical protein